MARTPRCAPTVEACRVNLAVTNDVPAGFVARLQVASPIGAPTRWELRTEGRGATVARAIGDAYSRAAEGMGTVIVPGVYEVVNEPKTPVEAEPKPDAKPTDEAQTMPLPWDAAAGTEEVEG